MSQPLQELLTGTNNAAMQQIGILPFLFLLAVSLAVSLAKDQPGLTMGLAIAFLIVALFFVWRSFYGMRIQGSKS